MIKKQICWIAVLLVTAVLLTGQNALSQGIKDRMKQRLPVIVDMKSKGIIGENAQGYLEFVSANQVNQDVVNAENQDRQAVYQAIAAQQGVSPETVGQRRALQIAENAGPGEFLKKADGNWVKK